MRACSFILTVAAVVFTVGAGCGKSPKPTEPAKTAPAETESAPVKLSGPLTHLSAKSGSKMRIEGTSSVHDWQVESKMIGGSLDAGKNFPTEPGQEVKPGPVEARVEAFVTVRSLQSLNKDGSHYSDDMNEDMRGKLKMKEQQKIIFS